MPPVRVTSAREAAARDAAAITLGTPAGVLMHRAGAGAAHVMRLRYADRLREGVVVYAGQGNNGGDGWVVAGVLARAGARVHVIATGMPRSDEAAAARDDALPHLVAEPVAQPGIVVDALLGTGAGGPPRERSAELIARMNDAGRQGSEVVALDVPSGVDATTGEQHRPHVRASLTVTFGTLKRGLLRARDVAGDIVVIDIGLPDDPELPVLVDRSWVADRIPTLGARAHKGTRGKIVVIGGARGMAGAATLAGRAALRSGVGMVRLLVAPESVGIVQGSLPEALASDWPVGEGAEDSLRELVGDWADAVLIGPGLGDDRSSRSLVETVLRHWSGPVVLDADALNVFEGDASALGSLLGGRPALITPHLMEFSRLTGTDRATVQEQHFEAGATCARSLRAAVLLKGVPTVISSPDGRRFVSAQGTPALATAGSGDVLAGIATTLISQLDDPAEAGACAAWAHGCAAEYAGIGRPVRGVVLADVIDSLALVWPVRGAPSHEPPIVAELPAMES
jgi:ADP-dependent NAD(P)H-hydrate dehydratase / NAD(P)H-hydrate epimerase